MTHSDLIYELVMDCRYKIVHSASRGAPWKPWTSTSSEGRCSVSFLQISPLNFCRRYLSANTVVTCNGLTAVISKLKNFGNVTVLPTVTKSWFQILSSKSEIFHWNLEIWNFKQSLNFWAKSEISVEISNQVCFPREAGTHFCGYVTTRSVLISCPY